MLVCFESLAVSAAALGLGGRGPRDRRCEAADRAGGGVLIGQPRLLAAKGRAHEAALMGGRRAAAAVSCMATSLVPSTAASLRWA